MPSFEQYRSDIAKLSETAKAFQKDSAILLDVLRSQPRRGARPRVSLSVATVAAILALLAGFLIGRALP
jgi:hypothetical protein